MGSERYQRALLDLATNPKRYGKVRERTQEERFSTQQVAPKLAAAQRDLDRLKAGELKDIDRAMQALRQQQRFNRRLEERLVRVPDAALLKQRITQLPEYQDASPAERRVALVTLLASDLAEKLKWQREQIALHIEGKMRERNENRPG